MVVVPAETPVATPETGSMVAIAVEAEFQTPPETASVMASVCPTQAEGNLERMRAPGLVVTT